MDERNEKIGADAKMYIRTNEKLENFWYHYKWHTIVALFVLVVGVILTLQLCTKTDYDLHVIYAGEKIIRNTSLSGDGKTEYSDLTSALGMIGKNAETDENVNVNLQNIYILSEKELEEKKKETTDPMQKARLESEMQTNYETLYSSIMYGDYYLCFLSEDVFLDYESRLDSSIFAPISGYTADGVEYSYAGERGIYLSSLAVHESTMLSMLPDDTVVCIRLPGVLGARDDGKAYAVAEDMLRKILSYGK